VKNAKHSSDEPEEPPTVAPDWNRCPREHLLHQKKVAPSNREHFIRMFVCGECRQFDKETTHIENMFCYGCRECNYNICKSCALKPKRRSGYDMDLQERRERLAGRVPKSSAAASSSSTKRKQEKMTVAEEESKMPPRVIDSEEEAILPESEFDEVNPLDYTLEELFNARKEII